MEYVKKAALGYKPVDRQDPDCSHVIMSIDEYRKLLEDSRLSIQRAESDARKACREMREQLQQAENETQKAIQEVQDALEAQKRETARQEDLNANLLRISRERANADRGLRPKKKHTGYAVLASAEKSLRYKTDRGVAETLVWETTLQTPHSVELQEDQVRLLLPEIWPQLCRIGIEAEYVKGYEAMTKDPAWKSRQENILVQHRLKANYRAGYWELIMQHTKPLGVVPADMR